MDYGIEGRVALVAASSKGLGKACAMGLAREGAKVTLCARNYDELQEAAQQIQFGHRRRSICTDGRHEQAGRHRKPDRRGTRTISAALTSWSPTPVGRRRGNSWTSPTTTGWRP